MLNESLKPNFGGLRSPPSALGRPVVPSTRPFRAAHGCKTARRSVFDFFIEIRESVRNSSVANSVDLTLRQFTGRNDPAVAALQARILLGRQQHSPFATILCDGDGLRECDVQI